MGCPATSMPNVPLSFSCQDKLYADLMNQSLAYPVGSQFIYSGQAARASPQHTRRSRPAHWPHVCASDLSMITMMHVVGAVALKQGLVSPLALNEVPPPRLPTPARLCCVPGSLGSLPSLLQSLAVAVRSVGLSFCRRAWLRLPSSERPNAITRYAGRRSHRRTVAPVIGGAWACQAFVRENVLQEAGMSASTFLPGVSRCPAPVC
jgi:hypothetical protein